MAPSDRQTGFTDIGGNFLCEGCVVFNNTDIINTAFGRDGFGNKILQVMWTGVRYAVTDKLDVITAYYHYTQNSYYGTPTAGPLPCSGSHRRWRGRRASRSGSVSVTTHALFALKVQRKLSNGVAGFAAAGSSLDRQKSRQSARHLSDTD
jgi:hypothetical protein